jgi:hypothetical protein
MKKVYILIAMVVLAALSRLFPIHNNFTPVAALALFSGAFLSRRLAFVVPVMAMLMADVLMGIKNSDPIYMEYLTKGQFFPVYIAMLLTAVIGFGLNNKLTFTNVLTRSVGASLLFFLLTNFGYWYQEGSLYPHTLSGLMTSYSMGIPFYKWTLVGDLFYTSVMFGAFYLLTYRKAVPAKI